MYDYGVDPAAEAMFLVLKDYRCSLRWVHAACWVACLGTHDGCFVAVQCDSEAACKPCCPLPPTPAGSGGRGSRHPQPTSCGSTMPSLQRWVLGLCALNATLHTPVAQGR